MPFQLSLSGMEIIVTDSQFIEDLKKDFGNEEEIYINDILMLRFSRNVHICFAENKPFHFRGSFSEEIEKIKRIKGLSEISLDYVDPKSYVGLHMASGRDVPCLQAYFLTFYQFGLNRDNTVPCDNYNYLAMPLKAIVPIKLDVLIWTCKIGNCYAFSNTLKIQKEREKAELHVFSVCSKMSIDFEFVIKGYL